MNSLLIPEGGRVMGCDVIIAGFLTYIHHRVELNDTTFFEDRQRGGDLSASPSSWTPRHDNDLSLLPGAESYSRNSIDQDPFPELLTYAVGMMVFVGLNVFYRQIEPANEIVAIFQRLWKVKSGVDEVDDLLWTNL